jgi:hypothetical protein
MQLDKNMIVDLLRFTCGELLSSRPDPSPIAEADPIGSHCDTASCPPSADPTGRCGPRCRRGTARRDTSISLTTVATRGRVTRPAARG